MEKKKNWKPMCLLITPETHYKIERLVKKREGLTKMQWVRDAIQEKFERKDERFRSLG